MEELLLRFSGVGKKIFKRLDNKGLTKCKKICKVWCAFLDNDSELWNRRIQIFSKNQIEFENHWNLVTRKVSVQILKDIALAMEQFFKFDIKRKEKQYSPLHIATRVGNISICLHSIQCTNNVNPKREDGFTPLHSASLRGAY